MEPVVWSTLGTTCGRCQAGLDIPVDLPYVIPRGSAGLKKNLLGEDKQRSLGWLLIFDIWVGFFSRDRKKLFLSYARNLLKKSSRSTQELLELKNPPLDSLFFTHAQYTGARACIYADRTRKTQHKNVLSHWVLPASKPASLPAKLGMSFMSFNLGFGLNAERIFKRNSGPMPV